MFYYNIATFAGISVYVELISRKATSANCLRLSCCVSEGTPVAHKAYQPKMFRGVPKPNRDIGTEWDAIQRRSSCKSVWIIHLNVNIRIGNLPELPEESDSDEERDYMEKSKSEAFREKVESAKDKDALEDEVGDDDEAFFEKYR